jgi:hypothetical protein
VPPLVRGFVINRCEPVVTADTHEWLLSARHDGVSILGMS